MIARWKLVLIAVIAPLATVTIAVAAHLSASTTGSALRSQPLATPSSGAIQSATVAPIPAVEPGATSSASAVASVRSAGTAGRSATYVSYFGTLTPGSLLPSDGQCEAKIRRNPWEPRPQNSAANTTNVYQQGFRLHNSYLASYGSRYEAHVTGNFAGTTDEILRWGACKWGFDEDTVRAQAVIESYWTQSNLGDCTGRPTQPSTHGCESVGILQVRGADIPPTHPGTWPAALTSTAFNVDYTLGARRACFDGKVTWLRQFNPSYAAGDLWGCIGLWFSGRWHDPGANQYIQRVQAVDAAKPWRRWA